MKRIKTLLLATLFAAASFGQTNQEPYGITIRSEESSDLNVTEFDDNHRAVRNFFTQTEGDYHFWIPGGASDPASCDPSEGDGGVQLWYNSTAEEVKVCDDVDTWSSLGGGGGTAAGSDTYVQFNDGGTAFGGDDDFIWQKTGPYLELGATTNTTEIRLPSYCGDTTPTIGFGTGNNTGICENGAGVLSFLSEGTAEASVTSIGILAGTSNRAALLNEAASNTNPTVVTNSFDLTTGIGGTNGPSTISGIIDGNEEFRLADTYFALGITDSLDLRIHSDANYFGQGNANTTSNYTADWNLSDDCSGDANAGYLTINASEQIVCSDAGIHPPTDSPPTCDSGTEGMLYYDDSLNEHCACNGATPSWNQLDGGGGC